jgi:hypothetical protein
MRLESDSSSAIDAKRHSARLVPLFARMLPKPSHDSTKLFIGQAGSQREAGDFEDRIYIDCRQ